MCRFTAYYGKTALSLKAVLSDPVHSLVTQSRSCKENITTLNGDGFGIGWYNLSVDTTPAIFKSTLPAWNDENLNNITPKILSNCFAGHVRASTVGSVNVSNCHPFSYKDLMFLHNGTIDNFCFIKKHIIQLIDPIYLENVKGQTDSEYFFALLCTYISPDSTEITQKNLLYGLRKAIKAVNDLMAKYCSSGNTSMNLLITNGKSMLSTRYTSNANERLLSLYYSQSFLKDIEKGIFISSEILDDQANEWSPVPLNHYISVNEAYEITIAPLEIK